MLQVLSRPSMVSRAVFPASLTVPFQLTEVVDLMLGMSHRKGIKVANDAERLRPIDAYYQMFDNSKIRAAIDWKPQISARKMFSDLLAHWRQEISKGKTPLNR